MKILSFLSVVIVSSVIAIIETVIYLHPELTGVSDDMFKHFIVWIINIGVISSVLIYKGEQKE